MTENTTAERAYDWEDEIENGGAGGIEYVTLPEGTEAAFEVVGFERERYTPGPNAKLPPCNKAVIEIRVDGFAEGQTIKENLFLHSRCEGILCAFFASIGQRQHGEKLKMNWPQVIGSKGRAKFSIRKYEKDGQERTINQVKTWLDPEKSSAGYTPGTF
jgi:hypothetical protein